MFARTRFYGFLFLFFLGVIASLTAQQEAFRVYVPVNEQGEPTGDQIYISESFRDELLRASRDSGTFRKNWSITGAKYLCSFSLAAQPQPVSGPTLTNFRAIYEIHLETDNATIVLPKLPILPEGTKWDGLMIQPVSLPATASDSQTPALNQLFFHVERQEPGRHTLEIALNPVVEQVDTVRRIALPSIPKVADAVLELNLSPDMPTISVEESLGQITDEPGKLSVQLGPTEKLTLTWNDNTVRPSQTGVESEQLYLLSAQANQLGVSVLHKFRITGEKIQQLDLVADPALLRSGSPIYYDPVYESPTDTAFPTFETRSLSDGLTRVVFREPISGQFTLRVNYFLRNFSGIGVVRFPQIPTSPYRVTQCWIGVRSVPTLEFDSLPPSTINLERFRQEWGTAPDDRSDRFWAAYEARSLPSSWMLSIRARKPTLHAKIRQAVLVHQSRTDYFVETALESNGSRFSSSYFVPENLRIERVDARVVGTTISDSSYQIPIDWRLCPPSPETPDGLRVLSILSESPFREKQEITIKGFLPGVAGESVRNLPLVRLEQAETEEYQVDIFHDPSVVLAEASLPTTFWKKSETFPTVQSEFIGGIPYGTWTNSPAQGLSISPAISRAAIPETEMSPIRLSVIPNAPEISGRQTTQLSWNVNTNRFEITTIFDLFIENGELNSFRLRYDDQCEFPPTIIPATKTEELSDEGERFVVLRFSQPLSGKTHFTIKATTNAASESVSLPKIFPSEPYSIKHYVVLPNDHLLRPIQWEKNQLLSVEAEESEEILRWFDTVSRESETGSPSPVSVSLPTSENYEVLTVSGPDFNARLIPSGNRPTVHLNDVQLYLRKNGYISGVSTFDLQGNGTDHCVLILPEPYELVSITAGGVTARGTPLAPGRWMFDLWSSQLPQKVEVVFRGRFTVANESTEETLLPMYVSERLETLPIELPSLESTNVLGTIWTLVMETPNRSRPLRFLVDQNRQTGIPHSEAEKTGAVLPRSARDAVSCLIYMDLFRISNMEAMIHSISTNLNAPQADVISWYSFWGRSWWGFRRELDSLLLSRQMDPQTGDTTFWKNSLFSGGDELPQSMKRIFDSTKRPEQLAQEFTESYEKAIPASLQPQDREWESDAGESTAFAVFRTSYSENISYLFGVSGGELTVLHIVSLPEQPTLLENRAVRFTLGFLAISVGVILIRAVHPRRLFRQYPFFVGHFVAILLWLLLPPGFLGLALLPLLWLAILWPGWKHSSHSYPGA